jgi:hypothetical protein
MHRATAMILLAGLSLSANPLASQTAHAAGLGAGLTAPSASDDPEVRANKVRNLRAMSNRVTLDVTDQPIGDVFEFLARVTGADLEPIFIEDDLGIDGFDPETTITLKATNMPALSLLERLLARVESAERPASGYTWQFTDTGSIEVGPKVVLNRSQFIELYDIAELLFVVPRFDNAPQFDLSSALQSGAGGGGGTSPFQNAQDDDDDISNEDRIAALVNLIETTVEPEQWVNLGGDGASMTTFGTSLVITAPDYIHRQINGYDFWPARLQQVRTVNGRREVRIRPDSTRSPDASRTNRP